MKLRKKSGSLFYGDGLYVGRVRIANISESKDRGRKIAIYVSGDIKKVWKCCYRSCRVHRKDILTFRIYERFNFNNRYKRVYYHNGKLDYFE